MSSTGSLEASERASAEVQKTPNRVSLDSMIAKIAGENYFTIGDALNALCQPSLPQHQVMTVCVLTMQNGYMMIGKSAPADAGNFDAELGKKFAREDAIRQLWPLEGYALREKLAA